MLIRLVKKFKPILPVSCYDSAHNTSLHLFLSIYKMRMIILPTSYTRLLSKLILTYLKSSQEKPYTRQELNNCRFFYFSLFPPSDNIHSLLIFPHKDPFVIQKAKCDKIPQKANRAENSNVEMKSEFITSRTPCHLDQANEEFISFTVDVRVPTHTAKKPSLQWDQVASFLHHCVQCSLTGNLTKMSSHASKKKIPLHPERVKLQTEENIQAPPCFKAAVPSLSLTSGDLVELMQ